MVKAGDPLLELDATDVKSELARMRDQLIGAQEEQKTALQGGSPDDLAQIQSDLAKIIGQITQLTRDREALSPLIQELGRNTSGTGPEQNRTGKSRSGKTPAGRKKEHTVRPLHNTSATGRSPGRRSTGVHSIDGAEDQFRACYCSCRGRDLFASGAFRNVCPYGRRSGGNGGSRAPSPRFYDEPELGSLKQGQIVEISWDALPARVWKGVIEQLPTTISTRGSRNVGEVLCSVNNEAAELLPNTNVNVKIRVAGRENVLTLPRAAVRTDGARRYVFVVEDNKVKSREVMVGISNPTTYEILGGITEQDTVALPMDSELREGQTVAGAER